MGILLFRLDDVTPQQNWENFERLHDLFRRYSIAPVIGVVPQNMDKKLCVDKPRENYIAYLKKLHDEEGWVIAQHGYTHTYVNRNGGMLKVNRQSEFAGLSGEEQWETDNRFCKSRAYVLKCLWHLPMPMIRRL